VGFLFYSKIENKEKPVLKQTRFKICSIKWAFCFVLKNHQNGGNRRETNFKAKPPV